MYKTVKTQTNLPVKICHLKVYFKCLSVENSHDHFNKINKLRTDKKHM